MAQTHGLERFQRPALLVGVAALAICTVGGFFAPAQFFRSYLFAFLFWGILWGVPGAILAVPLTATIKVVAERFDRFAPWAALLGDRTPDPVLKEEAEALVAQSKG